MTPDQPVLVSPRHSVRLASEYLVLLERPPEHDYVVQTVIRREANGLPLVTAEIVIAGKDTRADWPMARQFPLHFRKTYFAARLRGDPRDEFAAAERASGLLDTPSPIGHTNMVFRTCLIPGTPYARLSPFGLEPEDANLRAARDLNLATAAGLWRLAEEAYEKLSTLHAGGLAHGDAELHNFIVCPAPLELIPIDFEAAVFRDDTDEAAWLERCQDDLAPLLKEALHLQCSLGRQPGLLAATAWKAIEGLVADPGRVIRAVDRRADLGA